MNSIENSPFTLAFPSIEVALAKLGQKVFGATIVIAAPPAPPAPSNLPPLPLAPDISLHRSNLAALAQDQALVEARRERDDAAADAIAQREEVKRLANMLDKCQAGNRTRDASIQERTAQRDAWIETAAHQVTEINKLKRECDTREGIIADQVVTINHLTKECDECIKLRERAKHLAETLDRCQSGNRSLLAGNERVKAQLAKLETTHPEKGVNAAPEPTPTYRLLDVGETLREDDEVDLGRLNNLPESWQLYHSSTGATVKAGPMGSTLNPIGYYRRKLTPEEAATGYRLLAGGEVVAMEGDEFLTSRGEWVWAKRRNHAIIPSQVGLYRRTITPA